MIIKPIITDFIAAAPTKPNIISNEDSGGSMNFINC